MFDDVSLPNTADKDNCDTRADDPAICQTAIPLAPVIAPVIAVAKPVLTPTMVGVLAAAFTTLAAAAPFAC